MLGFELVRPGGVLATFSCSGHVDAALFQKIVAGAALDSGRDAQIIERLSQPPDHPIGIEFPEAEYLKGLILRVH
jgi:23S rRNA (cytosine1962-C5)-methyltransferase